jgi:RHS repeat-associated protein
MASPARHYYQHNLQGDIIGLTNTSGTQVVAYTYDSWGKQLTCTGSLASTLGVANPLRYRGYIYDEETGLYYLQSRYYNPVLGRFISKDEKTGHEVQYVGRIKNSDKRRSDHNRSDDKSGLKFNEVASGLTREEARFAEQAE